MIADRLRLTSKLKFLCLEIQDFAWLDSNKFWETIGLFSELTSLVRLSIMFYPKRDDIRLSSAFRRLLHSWLARLRGAGFPGGHNSQFGMAIIPWEIRPYIPALDKVFGVKSYTDDFPGSNGCNWIWQARKGGTLKMGPLPAPR